MLLIRSGLALLLLCAICRADDFALHDGDTVAFLGDSITAARNYTKIVEHYTLLRFPERKIRFLNAGVGGDTATKALARLQRDVFDPGATVVTVALGINDIAWGMKANAESKQVYLDGLRTIIEQCRAHHVRPIICSPAITAELPDRAEQGFLQKMADEALALAKSLEVETVDLQRGMREVQRRVVAANEKEKDEKKRTRMHVEDGVHLNDLGHLAMAFALLKGLGAPAEVSSVVVDAEGQAVLQEEGCRVTEIRKRERGVSFVREDRGLPLTFGGFATLSFRWVPVPEGLDRYRLGIANLPPGEYEILVEGKVIGKSNAKRLAQGQNIALMTPDPFQPGAPWDAQSQTVRELVEARDKLALGAQIADRSLGKDPHGEKLRAALREQEEGLVQSQQAVARPYPYHFEVRRVDH